MKNCYSKFWPPFVNFSNPLIHHSCWTNNQHSPQTNTKKEFEDFDIKIFKVFSYTFPPDPYKAFFLQEKLGPNLLTLSYNALKSCFLKHKYETLLSERVADSKSATKLAITTVLSKFKLKFSGNQFNDWQNFKPFQGIFLSS